MRVITCDLCKKKVKDSNLLLRDNAIDLYEDTDVNMILGHLKETEFCLKCVRILEKKTALLESIKMRFIFPFFKLDPNKKLPKHLENVDVKILKVLRRNV